LRSDVEINNALLETTKESIKPIPIKLNLDTLNIESNAAVEIRHSPMPAMFIREIQHGVKPEKTDVRRV